MLRRRGLGIWLVVLITTSVGPTAANAQAPVYLRQWGADGYGPGQFLGPTEIAIDESGEGVYVVDQFNHRIQKFTADGTYLTGWGSLGPATGQFQYPHGLDVEGGLVYVADYVNNRIQVFTEGGAYVRQWGTLGTGDGDLDGPIGVAVDAGGNVYVAERHNRRVQKFTSTGMFLSKWGAVGTAEGQFLEPYAVAVDGAGDVYVTDAPFLNPNWARVEKFTGSGEYLLQWSVRDAHGVAVDGQGDVYISTYRDNSIHKFTSTGSLILQWGSPGAGFGQFYEPLGIDVGASGEIFVADSGNDRIQVFGYGPTPTRTRTWGRIKASYR